MTHDLDGEWGSTVFGPNGPITDPDKFSLIVNTGGDKLDEKKSKHGANNVSGNIKLVGGGKHHRIHIIDDKALPAAEYFGVLLFKFPLPNGETVHIIIGTRVLTTTPVDLKRGRRKDRVGNQEEGTWVATKPG